MSISKKQEEKVTDKLNKGGLPLIWESLLPIIQKEQDPKKRLMYLEIMDYAVKKNTLVHNSNVIPLVLSDTQKQQIDKILIEKGLERTWELVRGNSLRGNPNKILPVLIGFMDYAVPKSNEKKEKGNELGIATTNDSEVMSLPVKVITDQFIKQKIPEKTKKVNLLFLVNLISAIIIIALLGYWIKSNPLLGLFVELFSFIFQIVIKMAFIFYKIFWVIISGIFFILVNQVLAKKYLKHKLLIRLYWLISLVIIFKLDQWGVFGQVSLNTINIVIPHNIKSLTEFAYSLSSIGSFIKEVFDYIVNHVQLSILIFVIIHYLLPVFISLIIEKLFIVFLLALSGAIGLIPVCGDSISVFLGSLCSLMLIFVFPCISLFSSFMRKLENHGIDECINVIKDLNMLKRFTKKSKTGAFA